MQTINTFIQGTGYQAESRMAYEKHPRHINIIGREAKYHFVTITNHFMIRQISLQRISGKTLYSRHSERLN